MANNVKRIFDIPEFNTFINNQKIFNSSIMQPIDNGNGIWTIQMKINQGITPSYLNLWLWYIRKYYETDGGESKVAITYLCEYGFGDFELNERNSDYTFSKIIDYINEPLLGDYKLIIPVPIPNNLKSVKINFNFVDANIDKMGDIYFFADVSGK